MPQTPGSDKHPALMLHVAVAAERIRLDQADLARSLQEAYDRGASLRSLAVAAGISHEQVRRIVYHQHDGEARPRPPASRRIV
jgi:hypothetical protein